MTELNGEPAGIRELTALAMTNYGHFTTMRVQDGRVRGLSLHLDRLVRDCGVLFGTDPDRDRIRELARRAVADTEGPLTVRVTVYDPDLGLERPGADATPRILVTTRPPAAPALPPLSVRTAPHHRDLPEVKHVGLFGLLRLRRLAQLDGYDDVLLTDERGAVSEGATWNVGFFDGDRLLWPDAACLPGVTQELLRCGHGGPQHTARIDRERLGELRAAFALNAGVGVRPIRSIDGVEFDPEHPVLATLRKEYATTEAEPL
ncbi:aminotransferase class IV [Streptomyces rapamycinicus]|uniref:Aminotransferase n=2 Tax=Streptomyces rapamycinicus TaxID=1226757 RepID=A0A0A0NRS5_STRRN|nr:aminotransferase class IV [Streptomyces rapamycinicus]AGP58993.1 aminotransferase [Streptomyces rapamycinicus NRRL 5491]MBB4786714.1 branched-subunit amino acid aminotransferase/4-amino-4-deoxychorismate lyase [Streptomyces rapamycinicus]RLV77828.1 aminotransferase [Streptomyces rapamycinicus NRRL 5491]UTO66764.1 aminotransferase class IV [Streptomyces rapamycinicus]UTP34719.1 aminotransferase class IV [Streptomyces rapamycinicus NRRL 5491]